MNTMAPRRQPRTKNLFGGDRKPQCTCAQRQPSTLASATGPHCAPSHSSRTGQEGGGYPIHTHLPTPAPRTSPIGGSATTPCYPVPAYTPDGATTAHSAHRRHKLARITTTTIRSTPKQVLSQPMKGCVQSPARRARRCIHQNSPPSYV